MTRTREENTRDLMLEEKLRQEQESDIGLAVMELAQDIFDQAGCPDDFCVQAIGGSIVFGGTNRLILCTRGWVYDSSCCTEEFMQACDKVIFTRLCP